MFLITHCDCCKSLLRSVQAPLNIRHKFNGTWHQRYQRYLLSWRNSSSVAQWSVPGTNCLFLVPLSLVHKSALAIVPGTMLTVGTLGAGDQWRDVVGVNTNSFVFCGVDTVPAMVVFCYCLPGDFSAREGGGGKKFSREESRAAELFLWMGFRGIRRIFSRLYRVFPVWISELEAPVRGR